MELFMRRLNLLLTVLLLTFASGCSRNVATGRNQLILVSAAEVSAMGEAAKPVLTKQYGGEVASAELRAYVSKVGRVLVNRIEPEYANIKWEFTTLDSDIINAFALPGGQVFVSRGLIERFTTEAQLAGVLGHEIGHVTARHIDERLSNVAITEFGLGMLGQTSKSDFANLAAKMVTQGTLLKFSRDQEQESDALGIKYMVNARYDPHGMLEVLEILAEASEGSSNLELLSTHPDPKRRIKTVQALLNGQYAYTQNNRKYSSRKGRFVRDAMPHLNK